jgi:hypothetical protein
MSTPPRVVPTLTEVLDESRFRPAPSVSAVVPPGVADLHVAVEQPESGANTLQGVVAKALHVPEPVARHRPEDLAAVPEPAAGPQPLLHGMRSEAAMAPSAVQVADFQPFPEPESAPPAASLADFDLDLSLDFRPDEGHADRAQASAATLLPVQPEPAEMAEMAEMAETRSMAAPLPMPPDPAVLDALEDRLRQGLGQELRQALDDLLQRQLQARLEQSVQRLAWQLQQELHEVLVPQLEGLVDQALSEALRRERERRLG